MSNITLNEQLLFLRKEKGITQEELAVHLGVTNQSVSKWEAGICCPDIQLLPEIADYFNISIDELLGVNRTPDSAEQIMLSLKKFFTAMPEADVYHSAFTIASLLHECTVTQGYKKYVPWDTDKNYDALRLKNWNMSISSEAEGSTMHVKNSILFSSNQCYSSPHFSELRSIASLLSSLSETNTLKVLFILYELTGFCNNYATVDDISSKCRLSADDVLHELGKLPCEVRDDGETVKYRLEGKFLHIPALLTLFITP